MSFPRYERYKDSGVEWLGEVPEHWEVRRLRHAARIENGRDHKEIEVEEGGYPVFGSGGAFARASSFLSEKPSVLLGRKGTIDRPLYVDEPFWTVDTSFYTVVSEDMDAKFLYYQCLGIPFSFYSNGTALPSMTQTTLYEVPSLRPTIIEQKWIVLFVDSETAKIDGLIEEQRRLIELLKEKRQAVISHAVTKGLNPNAPMQDSGVEWMGLVPINWRVFSLGRVTLSACDGPFGSGLKSDHYTDDGVRVIRLQNIRDGEFNDTDAAFIDPMHYANLGDHDVRGEDLLIAGLGDDRNAVGRACVAPKGIEPAMVKADCFCFRLASDALPSFIAAQLSVGAPSDAGRLATGSTRSRIPVSKMSSRTIALPSPKEQSEIVKYLHAREADFAGLRSQAELGIALLQERRSALISAAVTGKIDVRNYVPKEAA
jgi:type I restriction enzyme S subunit